GAPVLRIWRQDMHQHVVVRLSIIAHEAEHLDLDGPLPRWVRSDTQIAFLRSVVAICDIQSGLFGVDIWSNDLEFGCDEPHYDRLSMWTDTWLIRRPISDTNGLRRRSSI